MKNLFYIFILVAVVFVGYQKINTKSTVDENIKTYGDSTKGFYFSYPKKLSVSSNEDIVTLHHQIPYKNNGDCDMMGDDKTYDNLTDFKVTIQFFSESPAKVMQEKSPYIPKENFVNDEVMESPGFIDRYTVGNLNGFAIYEGAEGCGQTAYYFEVGKRNTMLVTKMSIQTLSGVISKEKEAEVLKVPGVISREESEEIFKNILLSIKL